MPGNGGPSSGNRRAGPSPAGTARRCSSRATASISSTCRPVSIGANDTPSAVSAIPYAHTTASGRSPNRAPAVVNAVTAAGSIGSAPLSAKRSVDRSSDPSSARPSWRASTA